MNNPQIFGALLAEVESDIRRIDDRNSALDIEKAANLQERSSLEGVAAYLRHRTGDDNETPSARGTSIVETAVAVLESTGPPSRSTREMLRRMTALGWTTGAKNSYTTVYATLKREHERDNRRIEKDGPNWALPGWPHQELMPGLAEGDEES